MTEPVRPLEALRQMAANVLRSLVEIAGGYNGPRHRLDAERLAEVAALEAGAAALLQAAAPPAPTAEPRQVVVPDVAREVFVCSD